MITSDLAVCQKCGFKRALTHYSSDTSINWVACPKCRSFFDFGKEVLDKQVDEFWKNVEEDTGYNKHTVEWFDEKSGEYKLYCEFCWLEDCVCFDIKIRDLFNQERHFL